MKTKSQIEQEIKDLKNSNKELTMWQLGYLSALEWVLEVKYL